MPEQWLRSLLGFIGSVSYIKTMRLKLFLILAVFLFQFVATAQQEQHTEGWYIGFTGGMLLGDIPNANFYQQMKNRPSFTAGGLLGYQFRNSFSLQLEVNFERRIFNASRYISGLRLTDTSTYVCWQCYYDFQVDYVSEYISFPFLFNYSSTQKRLTFGVQAGLYYSILLVNNHQGTETYYLDPLGAAPFSPEFEPGTFTTVYSGVSENIINTYDAGMLLGISSKYAVNNDWKLSAEARLIAGFTGIWENPQMPLVNFRGYVFRLGVYYTIPI